MNIIGGIKFLTISLIALVITISLLLSHFYFSKAEQNKYEKLISEGIVTKAKLNQNYKRTNFTIKGHEIEILSTHYSFSSKGNKYTGYFHLDHLDSLKEFIEIRYLPKKPNINDCNVKQKLEKIKYEKEDSFNLFIAKISFVVFLGSFIIGFLQLKSSSIIKIIINHFKQNKK